MIFGSNELDRIWTALEKGLKLLSSQKERDTGSFDLTATGTVIVRVVPELSRKTEYTRRNCEKTLEAIS